MKGLEISKLYYNEFGNEMLKMEFSEILPRLAVGVMGEGSDCLGYDDDISRDHDFEPGFMIFITRQDYEKFGFRLERAYAKLPKEFMGLKRETVSAVGGARRGVMILEDFLNKFLGVTEIPVNNLRWWMSVPSQSLLSICNGEIFFDNLGEISNVRKLLYKGYPEDIRRKKIAYHTIFMAQAGQYNYKRLIDRKEYGASQLAVFEFVKHTISTIYLLNNKYEPFYKWAYKGMRELNILGELESSLQVLTETENSCKTIGAKLEIIEDISEMIIDEFKKQGITKATCNNLETHAYSVLDSVEDNTLRNMNIMEGV